MDERGDESDHDEHEGRQHVDAETQVQDRRRAVFAERGQLFLFLIQMGLNSCDRCLIDLGIALDSWFRQLLTQLADLILKRTDFGIGGKDASPGYVVRPLIIQVGQAILRLLNGYGKFFDLLLSAFLLFFRIQQLFL